MTATDELRRLLDERGVEHVDAEDGHTQHTWWSDGDHEICASNSGERLAVYNLTPAQAVEATLGRGTCNNIAPSYLDFLCSECGFIHYHSDANDSGDGNEWRYCPNCGKVVRA